MEHNRQKLDTKARMLRNLGTWGEIKEWLKFEGGWGVLLTCRVGVYASLSAPSVWLYLCLPPPLASPPPPSPPPPPPVLLSPPQPAYTLHCTRVSPSLHAGRRPGSFHPQQLVALFTCTTHICAQLPARLRCIHSRMNVSICWHRRRKPETHWYTSDGWNALWGTVCP